MLNVFAFLFDTFFMKNEEKYWKDVVGWYIILSDSGNLLWEWFLWAKWPFVFILIYFELTSCKVVKCMTFLHQLVFLYGIMMKNKIKFSAHIRIVVWGFWLANAIWNDSTDKIMRFELDLEVKAPFVQWSSSSNLEDSPQQI